MLEENNFYGLFKSGNHFDLNQTRPALLEKYYIEKYSLNKNWEGKNPRK